MSQSALRIGWSVVRSRYAEAVPLAARRRRTRVAGIAAGAAGTVLAVTQAAWHWCSGPLTAVVLALALLAAAVGCFTASFIRIAPHTASTSTSTGFVAPTPLGRSGNWRRGERIAAQWSRNPPAMEPEDRDVVIEVADEGRDPLVQVFAKVMFMPAFWVFATAGLLASGLPTSHFAVLSFPAATAVLQLGTPVSWLVTLGRRELARERAMALPPSPPEQPRTWPRGGRSSGSKLGLPGD